METNKDSLQIIINDDGSVSFDWDKNDPKWNWMNKLTSKQVEEIVKRESSWADGWQKWHEYKKSSEIATEAKERFDNYQKQYGQYTDC